MRFNVKWRVIKHADNGVRSVLAHGSLIKEAESADAARQHFEESLATKYGAKDHEIAIQVMRTP